MLPDTLTQLCSRELACQKVVTSICVVRLHSCRICAMGCEAGACSPTMCTRKSSVLSKQLPQVWRRLSTLLMLPQGRAGSGPPVSFARSGITAAWDPKFRSLLELAEACDVPVRWSCRTGVCHTCMTGLIDGSIVYNPEPLERPATGNVLVCCSQPNAAVTLDL